jgi:hypothetical protein
MIENHFVLPFFVTDNNGDVWKRVHNGYVHRMYGLFWNGHPNYIPDNLKKRILHENMKRTTKFNKHNWKNIYI